MKTDYEQRQLTILPGSNCIELRNTIPAGETALPPDRRHLMDLLNHSPVNERLFSLNEYRRVLYLSHRSFLRTLRNSRCLSIGDLKYLVTGTGCPWALQGMLTSDPSLRTKMNDFTSPRNAGALIPIGSKQGSNAKYH